MTGRLSKQSGHTGAIHYVASKLEPTFVKSICIYINILRYLYTNNVIACMLENNFFEIGMLVYHKKKKCFLSIIPIHSGYG